MRLIQTSVLILVAVLFAVTLGLGKPEYSKKEGKSCTFCHPAGKFKDLTDAGKYYKEHDHSLEGYKVPESK